MCIRFKKNSKVCFKSDKGWHCICVCVCVASVAGSSASVLQEMDLQVDSEAARNLGRSASSSAGGTNETSSFCLTHWKQKFQPNLCGITCLLLMCLSWFCPIWNKLGLLAQLLKIWKKLLGHRSRLCSPSVGRGENCNTQPSTPKDGFSGPKDHDVRREL